MKTVKRQIGKATEKIWMAPRFKMLAGDHSTYQEIKKDVRGVAENEIWVRVYYSIRDNLGV